MEDLTSGAAHAIPMQNLQRQLPEASEECSLFKALPTYGATNSAALAQHAEDTTVVADQRYLFASTSVLFIVLFSMCWRRGSLAWDLSTMPYALAGVDAPLLADVWFSVVACFLFRCSVHSFASYCLRAWMRSCLHYALGYQPQSATLGIHCGLWLTSVR